MAGTKTEGSEGLRPLPLTASATVELPDVASRVQVADYTGIAVPTLARWAVEGKGPKFIKAGGRVLYRRQSVLAWLDELEAAS